MADVVNLNRARKDKARNAAKGEAAQNRLAFGRTKSERGIAKAQAEKATRELEGKKRE